MTTPQHNVPAATQNPDTSQDPPSYDFRNIPVEYYTPRVRDFAPDSCGTSLREHDNESLLPSYTAAARPWGRYRSEEAYLSALRDFVKQKEYVDGPVDQNGNPVGIIGFYGTKTMSDYAALPGLRDGRRRSKARKQSATDSNGTDQDRTMDSDRSNTGDSTKSTRGVKKWFRKSPLSSSVE